MLKKSSLAFIIGLLLAITAAAQEVEVDRYQINVRVDPAASAADCRAAITVVNLGQSPKTKLYFRLTKMAKVTSVTVNGTTAQVETSDDRRVTGLNQVVVSTDGGPKRRCSPMARRSFDDHSPCGRRQNVRNASSNSAKSCGLCTSSERSVAWKSTRCAMSMCSPS